MSKSVSVLDSARGEDKQLCVFFLRRISLLTGSEALCRVIWATVSKGDQTCQKTFISTKISICALCSFVWFSTSAAPPSHWTDTTAHTAFASFSFLLSQNNPEKRNRGFISFYFQNLLCGAAGQTGVILVLSSPLRPQGTALDIFLKLGAFCSTVPSLITCLLLVAESFTNLSLSYSNEQRIPRASAWRCLMLLL